MSIAHAPVTGQVTINDEPNKHTLYRFCEKKIDQWLRSQVGEAAYQSIDGEPVPIEFRVAFHEEDGRTGQVSCTTEISLHGASWRGWDLASDTQQALIHSLKRMQPH